MRPNGHSPDETNIVPHVNPLVGPDVPFVIPRLMNMKNMVAVIHSLTVRERYTAYPIGYFANPRPPQWQNTQPWTCTTFGPRGLKGVGWSIRNDAYDYELGPYITAGKVRWLDPDDPEHPVRQGRPADCPYYNLPGLRLPKMISWGKVYTYDNPDGVTEPDPFNLRGGNDE